MSLNYILQLALSLLFLSSLLSCQNLNSWPKQAILAPAMGPTKKKPQAIGYYSAGCLHGATTFEGKENGIELAHVGRGRFWGHPLMIDLLTELGEFTHKNFKKKVIIGDISHSRGGPTTHGHHSHQNGLDVDIWFKLAPRHGRAFDLRETEVMDSVLKGAGFNRDFGKSQKLILSFLAQDQRVARIFVHPKIKKNLCQDKSGLFSSESLRRIRPWYGHDDHLHLRLKCPDGDLQCQAQDDPEVGSGCDQLSWWDSQEAKEKAALMEGNFEAGRARYIRTINKLPAACENIYLE